MARAKPIPGLEADTPLAEAAARTVQVRSAEIFSFAGGVLDTGDIERVHDMRVATRRLRAVLEVYSACFEKPAFKTSLRDVKTLARALGARRDPDVALQEIEAIAVHLPGSARPGVDAIKDELRAEQAEGNVTLERELAVTVESQLEARLLELAASASDDGETFGDHARDMIDNRTAKLRKLGRRAIKSGEMEDLHAVRIGAKRVRYLHEIAEPAFGAKSRRGGKQARQLQDVLGELHDCDVMSERIRSRAWSTAVGDPRYLGYEALASYLDAKRRVLHRQYVDMWMEMGL
jgi:CHAD domain-containing protein